VFEEGGTFYVAGRAINGATGQLEAILWTGIPAPSTGALLALAGFSGARRRRA
jgi:hypothetical protein